MSNGTHAVAAQSGLLPALHHVQEHHGYIPEQAIARLAKEHNVSKADVMGVIGFYHDFLLAPPGRTRLKICRAESCQAMGADALAEHARQRLGIEFGETSKDGAHTLEAVYCLGNCACSPAVMLDGKLYGKVTPDHLDALLAEGQ